MLSFNLEFIKKRRKELGLSPATVANEMGFSDPSVYWKYENGSYKWKAEMLPQLAKILNCKIQNFFAD